MLTSYIDPEVQDDVPQNNKYAEPLFKTNSFPFKCLGFLFILIVKLFKNIIVEAPKMNLYYIY